jgi:hypothetical protein
MWVIDPMMHMESKPNVLVVHILATRQYDQKWTTYNGDANAWNFPVGSFYASVYDMHFELQRMRGKHLDKFRMSKPELPWFEVLDSSTKAVWLLLVKQMSTSFFLETANLSSVQINTFKAEEGKTLYRMMSLFCSLVSIIWCSHLSVQKPSEKEMQIDKNRLFACMAVTETDAYLKALQVCPLWLKFVMIKISDKHHLSILRDRISYPWLLPPTPWQQRWAHWLWWCLEWCLDADIALSLVTFAPLSVQFSKHILGLYLRWL